MNAPPLRALVEQAREPADAEVRQGPQWPAPLDLQAIAKLEPRSPNHIIENWLPEGEVTLLAGHGGAGKSAIALHLGACVALGVPWHGIATSCRPVLYVSAEDGKAVLHWRLSRIARHLGVRIDEMDMMQLIDASGMDAELMVETSGDEPILTELYDALRDRIEPGAVLILDGASDLFGASEIIRRHVRRYIRALRRLAGEHGAVLLLAHIDKAIARGRESGDYYSGSTAWNNSVRARWALRADGDGLALALEKANHSKAGAEIRLRWDPKAHMHLPLEQAAEGGIVGSIRERQERDAIVAAMKACATAGVQVPAATSGPRTTWHVLSAQPAFPEALRGESRAARGRFWAHIEALRQCCTLRECSIRTPSRKWVGVLTLATEETR